MSHSVRVDAVRVASLDHLRLLIDDGERQGVRFARRLADEWASGANRFQAVDETDCTHTLALGAVAA